MNAFKIILIAIALLLVYVFSDNVKGYYRFTQYCEKEAGLKIYQKLESNQGWLVGSRSEAKEVAYFKGVKFARYKDKKTDEYFDVKYLTGKPDNENSFQIAPSNLSEPIKYRWLHFSEYVDGETRLGRYGNEVLDNEENKMIGLYNFSYEKFDRDYTPLDMNPAVRCPENKKTQRATFDAWINSINSTFIN